MAHMTFELGEGGRVVVDGCRGDLEINYGSSATVEVSGDRTLAGRVSQNNNELVIRGYNGDLEISVGPEVMVEGRRIAGDVKVEDVAHAEFHVVGGDLEASGVSTFRVSEIGGDLQADLHDGQAEIGRVGGDLHIENAASLRVGAVGGDAELLDIGELAGLGRIGGDLQLNWSGGLAEPVMASVGGDARIELTGDPSFVVHATVGGDISGDGSAPAARHAADDDADPSSGGDGHSWDLEAEGGALVATFGEGGAELRLTVGGDLELHGGRVTTSSFEGRQHGHAVGDFGLGEEMRRLGRDLKAMGRELAREVAREVRNSTRGAPGPRPRVHFQFNDKAFHFDADQIDRLTREAREAAAGGVTRAQEAVERALVNMVSSGRAPSAPSSPRAPEPPRPPDAPRGWTGQTVRIERETAVPRRATEEVEVERLAILRMVGEGRLGIDEAEVMLRALEARG